MAEDQQTNCFLFQHYRTEMFEAGSPTVERVYSKMEAKLQFA